MQLFANGFQYDFEDSELNWFLMTIEIKCRNGYGVDYEIEKELIKEILSCRVTGHYCTVEL